MRTLPAPLAGITAGALTLGAAELLAGVMSRVLAPPGTPSPLLAVGGAFVDRTPAWLKDWAIEVFGTADKVALGVGIGVVLVALCALLGLVAARSLTTGRLLFAAVGMVGVAAVLSRPGSDPPDALPTVAGTLVGVWALGRFTGPGRRGPGSGPVSRPGAGASSRRELLTTAGVLTALGMIGIVAGRAIDSAGRTVERAVRAFTLPTPARTVSVPADADPGIEGQATYLTPNDEFYRIDTALRVPTVDAQDWRLRVTGMVDTEIEISYAELLEQRHVEALVTLTCVSNEVGGDLVGNARWVGWPVRELLAQAGVQDGADMVLSRSADGWTAGTPIEALTDERDALLAVTMNGEPLPARHGFPVRLVVPGLYGYVSATKWVTELKVTRFDADEGYWTPRGWAALGPIKTASRIDVPRRGARVAAGPVTVAGVAWAQTKGIEAVQVRVDDGDWGEATLAGEPSVDSWRLWAFTWDATPGQHTLAVRATDGDGQVQTGEVAGVIPDGATGWHTVDVSVG
jgi:DMSO/TMAO reductase YedYZ molybdopterin-dependent catalytic subunit